MAAKAFCGLWLRVAEWQSLEGCDHFVESLLFVGSEQALPVWRGYAEAIIRGLSRWSLKLLVAFGCLWLDGEAERAMIVLPRHTLLSVLNGRGRFG